MGLFRNFPRVAYCCCCVDLRSGAIVIGILQLIGCILNASTAIISIYVHPDIEALLPSNLTEENVQNIQKLLDAMRYSVIGMCTFGLFFATMLIIGAMKGRILLLKIYLTVLFVMIVLFFGGAVALLFFVWPVGLVFTAILGVDCYLFLCINSYMQQLVDAQNGATNVEFKAVPQA